METMVKELGKLRKQLNTLLNNDYDDFTGREKDWTDLEEAKSNMYADTVSLIQSIDWVLDAYKNNQTH